jgi:flagellin-specific chaperone FliS
MTSALLINGPVTNSTLACRGGLSTAAGLMDGVLERLEAASELDEDGDPAAGDLLEAAVELGEDGDPRAAGDLLEAAVLLIRELRAGLDLHSGGAIAANVDDLYDYMCRRLGACLRLADATDPMNGLAALHEVSHLLDALRSAWAFMPAEVRAASRKSKAS